MSARYKCNQCLSEFAVSEEMGSQSCPYCGSFELTEKSGGIKINFGKFKKFLIPLLILIALIFLISVIIKDPDIVIDNVVYDNSSCRITVTAKPSKQGGKLEYSFDNGKTSQTSRVFLAKDPGTYIIVVKDNKNKTARWGVPITVTEDDLKKTVPPLDPPQIVGIEIINETADGSNDGQIKIHTFYGEKPLEFSINSGATWSPDSVFINLQPGKYFAEVKDALTRTAKWQDTIAIEPGLTPPPPPPSGSAGNHIGNLPTEQDVENIINKLFDDPESQQLLDSVNALFISRTMNVECELIGIPQNTPYQLFQFLERRFEGKPGSKRIEVISIDASASRITRLKVKEVPVQ